MIYVLLGATCSGKTTALETLVKQGYKTITSYTTRPKRPDEIDGVDYHFVTQDYFKWMDESGLLVAKNSFKSAFGDVWGYAINSQDIKLFEDQIVITEPSGYRDLTEKYGPSNVTGIYLMAPYDIRLARGIKREDNSVELKRRLIADEKDFEGLELEVDYIVDSMDKDQVIKEICNIMNGDFK
ncbi:guanylate kinase/L-type calcium channel region [Bacillus sp. Bos-x628]|uniref:guanylate kinase/L-type calcium channel region n=1 Tax=Bacillus maqinnsis TaxID=3229854 RepID=UPI003390744C